MKNLIKFFIAVFLLIPLLQTGYSQIPTYTLTAKNFQTNCYNNLLEWDIYLKHTNPPVDFDMAGHQYFFNFDTSVSNGGSLNYQIIGSDLPQMFQPRNPSIGVYNDTTVLRLASNWCPGLGNCGPTLTGNGGLNDSNGTLIVRVRLSTSTFFTFKDYDFLKWRNAPHTAPITTIKAYVGKYSLSITTPLNHIIDFPVNEFPVMSMINYPNFYASGLPHTVTFSWSSYQCNLNTPYKLEIWEEYNFNNYFFIDSNIVDTFKTVGGLTGYTTYHWRISAFNMDSGKYIIQTPIAQFGTAFGMRIVIKCLLEGIYQPASENLNNYFPVNVLLRNVTPPYAIVDSSLKYVNLSDIGIYPSFIRASSGTYYIVLKTLNGIETWSREGGVQLNYGHNYPPYNFIDSSSQAYGNNLKLKGDLYCIYSGDVNQDGMIDMEDLTLIDNDIVNSVTGINIPSDLNYDDVVDLTDLSICDNNVFDFISIVRP